MAPRRALARRAARLLGYWRSETRTIRQGLVALALSTAAGFVAGLILAHLTDTVRFEAVNGADLTRARHRPDDWAG